MTGVYGFVSVFAYKSNLEFKQEMIVCINVVFHCVDELKNPCSIFQSRHSTNPFCSKVCICVCRIWHLPRHMCSNIMRSTVTEHVGSFKKSSCIWLHVSLLVSKYCVIQVFIGCCESPNIRKNPLNVFIAGTISWFIPVFNVMHDSL